MKNLAFEFLKVATLPYLSAVVAGTALWQGYSYTTTGHFAQTSEIQFPMQLIQASAATVVAGITGYVLGRTHKP